MLGVSRKIHDLMRIGLMIVEFDVGFARRHPLSLNRRQLARRVQLLHHLLRGVAIGDVFVELRIGPVGHKVANQLVAAVADGADAFDGHVAAVARGEDMLTRLGPGEQPLAMHQRGAGHPGDLQRRGGDVQRDHGIASNGIRLQFSRPTHDQRHLRPRIVEPLLAPQQAAAVVAKHEDHGVVQQPIGLQRLEGGPHLRIPVVHRIQVVGHFVAHHGMVGIVRRQGHVRGVDEFRLLACRWPDGALMRCGEVQLGVERLSFGPLIPVGAVEGLGPFEVEVGLAGHAHPGHHFGNVGGEIARVVQTVRHQPDSLRQLIVVLAMAAMVVRPEGGLVNAGVPSRAAGRADGRGGEAVGEPNAFGRESIRVRRVDQSVAVAAEVGPQVVAQDPEDVGFTVLGL